MQGAPPDQFQSLLSDIQTCIEGLMGWMCSNKLKLNTEKTDVLPVGSASRLSTVGGGSVDIGGNRIEFKTSVRNLGVYLFYRESKTTPQNSFSENPNKTM